MTAETKASVKEFFVSGARPTESQFATLIDSYQDFNEFLQHLATATSTRGGFLALASVAASSDARRVTAFPVPLPVAQGGTGEGTVASARSALGVPAVSASNAFLGDQTFRSESTAAAAGPALILDRVVSAAAANDLIGRVAYRGRDSASAVADFATTQGKVRNPAAASAAGEFLVQVLSSGAAASAMRVGDGVLVGDDPTGGYQGPGTVNAAGGFFQNGVQLAGQRVQTIVSAATLPTASATAEATGIDLSSFDEVVVTLRGAGITTNNTDIILQFGDATDYTTSVSAEGATNDEQEPATTGIWDTENGIVIGSEVDSTTTIVGGAIMTRLPAAIVSGLYGAGYQAWQVQVIVRNNGQANLERMVGGGIFATTKTIDRVRLVGQSNFTSGSWAISGR